MLFYYDLHCHTSLSKDSPADLQRIIKVAKKRGLDGIAITDHDKTYQGVTEIDGVEIIPGNEITVKGGGHLLAYFISEEIPVAQEITTVINEIKKQGGHAILAHPFRKEPYSWMNIEKEKEVEKVLSLVDGLESGNGCDSEEERALARETAQKAGLLESAGSDLHLPGQAGFSSVAVKERLNSKNFKRVMKEAKIIIRPEAELFRRKISFWKKIVLRMEKLIGIYNNQMAKDIFLKIVVKNYFRLKNSEFEKIKFNLKNSS